MRATIFDLGNVRSHDRIPKGCVNSEMADHENNCTINSLLIYNCER